MRRLAAPVVACALVAACSADSISSDEHRELRQQVTEIEQQLADLSAERGSLIGQPGAEASTGGTVDVTVAGLEGYAGGDLAGVLYADPEGRVIGGFATEVDSDDFTTTQRILLPEEADELTDPWPHLSDDPAIVDEGTYTLLLWADTSLGAYSRWFPVNTDGRGLAGCVHTFEVGARSHTDVVVEGQLATTGVLGVCQHADVATPGTKESERLSDLAISADGVLYVASDTGIARRTSETGWVRLDVDGLPNGRGFDTIPGRSIEHLAVGPNGELWAAGVAISDPEDTDFGGFADGWTGARYVSWIAVHDCDPACEWQVFTSNDEPALVAGDVGDLALSADGSVYATADGPLLLRFDGEAWSALEVPLVSRTYPWSSSIAITSDTTVWAGTNHFRRGAGLMAFDGTDFTRYSTADGLPSDNVFQVAAAPDGTLWAATDTLYADPSTADPGAAGGVVHFDGETWTTYTLDDGLLSNDAVVVVGPDDTVWAIHYEIPPHGYSRYADGTWTGYRVDGPLPGFGAVAAPDGVLWGIADGKLVSFDGTTTTLHPSPFVRSDSGESSGREFDFASDSWCDWFTAEDMDRIVGDAQERAGTSLELVAFVPDGWCDSAGSWGSSSSTVSLAPRDRPGAVPDGLDGHELLDDSVAYGNLDIAGRTTSTWPPYVMRADIRVEGHEDEVLSFLLELWGPASIPGAEDLDEAEMCSLGLAVTDAMLRDMNWVD